MKMTYYRWRAIPSQDGGGASPGPSGSLQLPALCAFAHLVHWAFKLESEVGDSVAGLTAVGVLCSTQLQAAQAAASARSFALRG